MYRISAVFIGVLIAIMVTLNGILSGYVGSYLSLFIIHLIGLIAVSLILLITKRKLNISRSIPFYLFSAGVLGIFVVLFNILSVDVIGVSLTLAVGLFGQSVASGIIDHYGLLGMTKHRFQKEKIVGFLIILVGLVLMTLF